MFMWWCAEKEGFGGERKRRLATSPWKWWYIVLLLSCSLFFANAL
uniref:Uncharacterized protein n=1 Tax=Arundo donax TaxID=35708 RepID=A0A0A8YSD8_ARUDO